MSADESSKLLENSSLKMLQVSADLLVTPEAKHKELISFITLYLP